MKRSERGVEEGDKKEKERGAKPVCAIHFFNFGLDFFNFSIIYYYFFFFLKENMFLEWYCFKIKITTYPSIFEPFTIILLNIYLTISIMILNKRNIMIK